MTKIFGFVLLTWFVIMLACTFPSRVSYQESMIRDVVRRTLTAVAAETTPLPPQPNEIPGEEISMVEEEAQLSTGSLPTLNLDEADVLLDATLEGDIEFVEPASPFWINTPDDDSLATFRYFTQSGDSLLFLADRFAVNAHDIVSQQDLLSEGLITPGTLLEIPKAMDQAGIYAPLLPDSEVVYSPSVIDFSVGRYIDSAGGYLSRYREHVYAEWLTGEEIIERVAVESSLNPRLLLAFLEFRSGWVLGEPPAPVDRKNPLGLHVPEKVGLYQELVIAATQLNKGYYGGRAGIIREMKFKGGKVVRIHPELNAGTMGLQYLFSLFYDLTGWQESLYGSGGFMALYTRMFPGVWERASGVEPLLPAGLEQPDLELPFPAGERWSLTGGPHYSWNAGSPRGALDFAPVTGEPVCEVSRAWVTASAAGYVVRSAYNVLVIDLDEDRFEGTGWSIIYLHIAEQGSTPAGTSVALDDPLGHPSCERGINTGTHVHIARKYNGEWLPVEGSVPFVLSGWRVYALDGNYRGEMRKGEQVVVASPVGPRTSIISR